MAAPYGIIVDPNDFVTDGSFWQMPNDQKVILGLKTYINKFEAKYIYQILGQVQGDLMIADCNANNGVPIIPDNLAIFNAINLNDTNDRQALRQSEGLKNVLLGLIYYEFATSRQWRITLAGFTNTEVDTAEKLTYRSVAILAEEKWNEAVGWIHTIQWYCLIYSAMVSPPGNYTNFKGQVFTAVSADFL